MLGGCGGTEQRCSTAATREPISSYGVYAGTLVLVLFAQMAYRPWLRRRCDGEIPRASAPVAIGVIVASALIGEAAGRAIGSVLVGVVAFGLSLLALAAGAVLWTQSRRAREAGSQRASSGWAQSGDQAPESRRS